MKPTINPQLIEALDHYSSWGVMTLNGPTLCVLKNDKGRQTPWSIEKTAALAHHVLANEDLHLLKLIELLQGLNKIGLAYAYEHIMGERLVDALAALTKKVD